MKNKNADTLLMFFFAVLISQASLPSLSFAATPTISSLPSSFSGLDLTQTDDHKAPITIDIKSKVGHENPTAGGDKTASESKTSETLKGSVLVFLSARCPCSSSHENLLNDLQTEFKDFRFIGVHANQDEPLEESRKHFVEAKLKFPVLQDKGAQYADAFKAFKTPHAFVLSASGEILYQGGVTDSHSGPNANNFYLKQVLTALHQGQPAPFETKRALGCVISRKEKP